MISRIDRIAYGPPADIRWLHGKIVLRGEEGFDRAITAAEMGRRAEEWRKLHWGTTA